MKKRKIDYRIEGVFNWQIGELEVGDIIEINGIEQGLPEEVYRRAPYNELAHIRRYAREEGMKLRITMPIDKYNRRYVLIKRIKNDNKC